MQLKLKNIVIARNTPITSSVKENGKNVSTEITLKEIKAGKLATIGGSLSVKAVSVNGTHYTKSGVYQQKLVDKGTVYLNNLSVEDATKIGLALGDQEHILLNVDVEGSIYANWHNKDTVIAPNLAIDSTQKVQSVVGLKVHSVKAVEIVELENFDKYYSTLTILSSAYPKLQPILKKLGVVVSTTIEIADKNVTFVPGALTTTTVRQVNGNKVPVGGFKANELNRVTMQALHTMVLISPKDVVIEDADLVLATKVIASVPKANRADFITGKNLTAKLTPVRAKVETLENKETIYKLLANEDINVIQFGKTGWDIRESKESQIAKLTTIKSNIGAFHKTDKLEIAFGNAVYGLPNKDDKVYATKVDFIPQIPYGLTNTKVATVTGDSLISFDIEETPKPTPVETAPVAKLDEVLSSDKLDEFGELSIDDIL